MSQGCQHDAWADDITGEEADETVKFSLDVGRITSST